MGMPPHTHMGAPAYPPQPRPPPHIPPHIPPQALGPVPGGAIPPEAPPEEAAPRRRKFKEAVSVFEAPQKK